MELFDMMGLERPLERLVWRFSRASTSPMLCVLGPASDARYEALKAVVAAAGRPCTRVRMPDATPAGLQRLTDAIRQGSLSNHVLVFDRLDELSMEMVYPFRLFWNQLDLHTRSLTLTATAVAHPGLADFEDLLPLETLLAGDPAGALDELSAALRRIRTGEGLPSYADAADPLQLAEAPPVVAPPRRIPNTAAATAARARVREASRETPDDAPAAAPLAPSAAAATDAPHTADRRLVPPADARTVGAATAPEAPPGESRTTAALEAPVTPTTGDNPAVAAMPAGAAAGATLDRSPPARHPAPHPQAASPVVVSAAAASPWALTDVRALLVPAEPGPGVPQPLSASPPSEPHRVIIVEQPAAVAVLPVAERPTGAFAGLGGPTPPTTGASWVPLDVASVARRLVLENEHFAATEAADGLLASAVRDLAAETAAREAEVRHAPLLPARTTELTTG